VWRKTSARAAVIDSVCSLIAEIVPRQLKNA
jgi:hypothetical protein